MKKKQQTLCYEGEGCANFKNPILCSDCERNFDNFNIQDRFRYADEIPRKEDSGTLEEHLANLRKQSPAKCQDCECLHVENHGPDHAGYVYVCETSPKCYKENTTP